jgi:peptide/nickel transport system substrate-binding protein
MRFWLPLFLILLAGCPSTKSQPVENNSTSPKILLYARGEDCNTLDPIHTDIGETVKVLVNIYDTLVTYHEKTTELVPALAESWSSNSEGTVWTFKLRSNVQFHDGTPFNAATVKFSFERLIQEQHAQVYDSAVPYRPSYKMIERVDAPSEHKVIFHLREPSAVFLQNLAMFPASIVSPTAVMKHGKAYAEHPSGTGPFKLLKWNREQQLVLETNKTYWNGSPKIDNVIFLCVDDDATRIQKLKRGEAHIADDLPAAELDVLSQRPDIQVQEEQGLNVAYLTMQNEKGVLQHREVRLAIAQAIDKPRFVTLLYSGHATPAKTVIPPGMFAHCESLVDTAYNVEAAKQLLETAAKEHNFTLPLSLTLNVMNQPRPYLPEPSAAAAFIKDSLAKIGIQVTISPQDVNQHFPYLMAGKHELGLAGWTSDNSDPDNFLYSLLDSDNIGEHGNNLSRYANPQVHTLLRQGQTEQNATQREMIYRNAQEIIAHDIPLVPLAHARMRVAHSKQVGNYWLHPTGLVRLRHVTLD